VFDRAERREDAEESKDVGKKSKYRMRRRDRGQVRGGASRSTSVCKLETGGNAVCVDSRRTPVMGFMLEARPAFDELAPAVAACRSIY